MFDFAKVLFLSVLIITVNQVFPQNASPLVRSGLRLWLDATDPDGDGIAEGLQESVLSGNQLNEWKDKSPCSNHFVAYSPNKATFNTSAFGNRGGIVFANSTAMDETREQGVIGNTTAYTCFVVVKLNSTANQCILGTNTFGTIHLQYGGVNNGIRMMHNNSNVLSTGTLSNFNVTSPHIITAKYAAGETENNVIRVDGVLKGQNSTVAGVNSGKLRIGYYRSNQNPMTGHIGEVVVYNRTLTQDEIDAIEQYLSYKWGISTPHILPKVQVNEPVRYQTYQRSASGFATIPVRGTAPLQNCPYVEASFNGGSFLSLATNINGSFSGRMTVPAGQGELCVQCVGDSSTRFRVPYVGVGDVFVVAGQSNAEGKSPNKQNFSHPTLRASVFTERDAWKIGNDPTDYDPISVSNVYSGAGSVWPLLATHIMNDQNVPVAFITTALGGQTLAASGATWNKNIPNTCPTTLSVPGQNCYYNMLQQIEESKVNAVKSVLWHQGESDANLSYPYVYYDTLKVLAYNLHRDIPGNPTFTSASLGWKYTGTLQLNSYRNFYSSLWSEVPYANPGPVLYDIPLLEDPFYLHYTTNAQLAILAHRWFAPIKATLYNGTGNGRGPRLYEASTNNRFVYLNFNDQSLPLRFSSTQPKGGIRITSVDSSYVVDSVVFNSDNSLKIALPKILTGLMKVEIGGYNDAVNKSYLTNSSGFDLPAEPALFYIPTGPCGINKGSVFWLNPEKRIGYTYTRKIIGAYELALSSKYTNPDTNKVPLYFSYLINESKDNFRLSFKFNALDNQSLSNRYNNKYSIKPLLAKASGYTAFIVFNSSASDRHSLISSGQNGWRFEVADSNYFQVVHGNHTGLSVPIPLNQNVIAVVSYSKDSLPGKITVNGLSFGDTDTLMRNFTDEGVITLGANDTTDYYTGELKETIIYNRRLSEDEITKIQSYLSLKYSIPLHQDFQLYLSPFGQNIMDKLKDTTFTHLPFGLARDDYSGLSQIRAQDTTRSLMIVQSDSLPLPNDQSYLIASSNPEPLVWNSWNYDPNYQILAKKWRVSEVSETGEALFMIKNHTETGQRLPFTSQNVYMVVSSSADFLYDISIIPATLNATGSYWVAPFNPSNHQYFTFATLNN